MDVSDGSQLAKCGADGAGCLPDIVYVQVAGNEFDSTELVETIVRKYMFQARQWVDSLAVRRGILSMALPRSNARSMSARQYNRRVRQFNRLLSQQGCRPYPMTHGRVTRGKFTDPCIWYWHHERLGSTSRLQADGVHLAAPSLKRLYFSIRMALLEVSKLEY